MCGSTVSQTHVFGSVFECAREHVFESVRSSVFEPVCVQSHLVSSLCIFFPGGTGTIHEFVKFLTHDFHYNKKIILLGSYYENLYDMIINHNKYSSLIDEKITSNYDKYINKTIFFSNDTLINDKCLLREYLNFVFTS